MNKVEIAGSIRNSRKGFAHQLLKSHLLVALLGIFMLMFSLVGTYYLRTKFIVLAEERGPIALASSKVLTEVQHSLAGLRGWVSLGDEKILQEWESAWSEGIKPAMAALMKYQKVLKESEGGNLLNQLQLLLAELRESQWWVKSVAQTPGNEPARVSYLFEVEPVALVLDSILVKIFNDATEEAGTTDQMLLAQLIEIQRVFSVARRQLEQIVFDGGLYHENGFQKNLNLVQAAFHHLASQPWYVQPEHHHLLKLFQRELQAFHRLTNKAISLRKSDQWNTAQYLMTTETVPIANQITELTSALSSNSESLMRKHSSETSRATNIAMIVMVGLIGIMILFAFILSNIRANALTQPIIALLSATQEFASGKLDKDIPVISDDELGRTHPFL